MIIIKIEFHPCYPIHLNRAEAKKKIEKKSNWTIEKMRFSTEGPIFPPKNKQLKCLNSYISILQNFRCGKVSPAKQL